MHSKSGGSTARELKVLTGDQFPRSARGAIIRATVKLPLLYGPGKYVEAHAVTFSGLIDHQEHLAVRIGPHNPFPLVRLHSECLTGDVFRSARCDCGPQLQESIMRLSRVGGLIIYLRQEGRGIGLYNKLDAYELQEAGLDTYAANRALGFADDQREYAVGAQILHVLGRTRVDLLTNNPDKSFQLTRCGIYVRRVVQTTLFENPCNNEYLSAKMIKANQQTDRLKGEDTSPWFD